MLMLFLVLQAAGASHELHHLLHPESDSPDHQCVIRLVSEGQIHQAPPEIVLPVPQYFSSTVTVPQSFAPVPVDYRLLPGRAPPSSLP